MRKKRYLSSLIAVVGMSLVHGVAANDQGAEGGPGVQNYCDLVDGAVAANQAVLLPDQMPVDAHPESAFCSGLQAHGLVNFSGAFTYYYVNDDKDVMAGRVDQIPGLEACKTSTGSHRCDEVAFPSYKLTGPDHPSYGVGSFTGDPISVAHFKSRSLYPGDQAGVTTGNNAKVSFRADPNHDPNDPESVPNTTYRLKTLSTGSFAKIYMSPGDYYIQNVSLGNNNTMTVLGDGTVRLFVENMTTGAFNHIGSSNILDQMVIISKNDLRVNNNSTMRGYVYSERDVYLSPFSRTYGAVNGTNVVVENNVKVYEIVDQLANVDWGPIVANQGPEIELPPEDSPNWNRHSGRYNLFYPNSIADGDLVADSINGNAVIDLYDTHLDPENYVDKQVFADAAEMLPADNLLIGWVYGGIFVRVGAIPWWWGVALPIPIEPLELGDEQVLIDDRDVKIQAFKDDYDNPEAWIDTDPDVDGNVYYLHDLLREEDGDDDDDNNPYIVYTNPDDRAAAVQAKKDEFETKMTEYYGGIIAQWNTAFDYKAEYVDYGTFYPGGGQYGVMGYSFSNGGGWLGFLNHNQRASLPVFWPINLFPLAGWTDHGPIVAWCGAWLAAFEVGCFGPDADEPADAQCKYWFNNEDVDLAMFTFAGANLTCGVASLQFLFTGTIGFGISVLPYGEKL